MHSFQQIRPIPQYSSIGRERTLSLSLSLSLSNVSTVMPKLKNGKMVVVKVSMMMRKNTNTTKTHLLRRRSRRREGILMRADLEEKRSPHVFSQTNGVPTSRKQKQKKFTSSSRFDDDDDAGSSKENNNNNNNNNESRERRFFPLSMISSKSTPGRLKTRSHPRRSFNGIRSNVWSEKIGNWRRICADRRRRFTSSVLCCSCYGT